MKEKEIAVNSDYCLLEKNVYCLLGVRSTEGRRKMTTVHGFILIGISNLLHITTDHNLHMSENVKIKVETGKLILFSHSIF